MSRFFNEKLVEGLTTGKYYCEKCGSLLEFEDEDIRDTLICPSCGSETDLDHYGFTDEEYNDLYPTYEEVVEEEEFQKCKKK